MVKFKKGYFYKTNIKKNNFMLFFLWTFNVFCYIKKDNKYFIIKRKKMKKKMMK